MHDTAPSAAQVAVACTDGGVQELPKAFNVETTIMANTKDE